MLPKVKQQEEAPIVLNTDDEPIRIIGYAILFVMIGIFGTWSYIAPLSSSALASGIVAVKSHRKTIQHLEGGIVSTIQVQDGDLVNVGDALLTLDQTQVKAQIKILLGQYITATVINARLSAERRKVREIKIPKKLTELHDHRVKESISGQTQIFEARRSSREGELDVLKKRIEQLRLKVRGLANQQKSERKLAKSYAEEIQDLKELLAEGFADKQRLRELQRQHTQTNSQIASFTTEIASTKMQEGETELQILQIERKFQEEVVTQAEDINANLFSIAEQLVVAKDSLQRSTIYAPVKGVVLGLSAHTEGGVILAGRPILDIVPEDEELIINAQVSLIDIDQVHLGTEAEIRFSAFSSKTTPVMEGIVLRLSADSLLDEVTGMQYYQATIGLTQESRQSLGDLVLIPGMPAEVLIKTGARTLFKYLTSPLSDAFARSFTEE